MPEDLLFRLRFPAFASLAAAAALRLRWLHIPVAGVYTFAAPRIGDRALARLYAEQAIPTARYEFRDDVVPFWPFQPGEIDAIIGDRSFWQKLLDHFFDGIVGSEFSDVGNLRYSGDGVRLESVAGQEEEGLNAWRRGLLARERKDIGFEGLIAHAAQAHPLEGSAPPESAAPLTSYETMVCRPD